MSETPRMYDADKDQLVPVDLDDAAVGDVYIGPDGNWVNRRQAQQEQQETERNQLSDELRSNLGQRTMLPELEDQDATPTFDASYYNMNQEAYDDLIAEGFEPNTEDWNHQLRLTGMGKPKDIYKAPEPESPSAEEVSENQDNTPEESAKAQDETSEESLDSQDATPTEPEQSVESSRDTTSERVEQIIQDNQSQINQLREQNTRDNARITEMETRFNILVQISSFLEQIPPELEEEMQDIQSRINQLREQNTRLIDRITEMETRNNELVQMMSILEQIS